MRLTTILNMKLAIREGWYAFDYWLRDNGYMTEAQAYNELVSRGEDPEKIYNKYEKLEGDFINWCDKYNLEPILN